MATDAATWCPFRELDCCHLVSSRGTRCHAYFPTHNISPVWVRWPINESIFKDHSSTI